MLDAASYLIPYPFYFFGEEIRATLDRILAINSALELARFIQAPQSIIDAYAAILNALESASGETGAGRDRSLTAPHSARFCLLR